MTIACILAGLGLVAGCAPDGAGNSSRASDGRKAVSVELVQVEAADFRETVEGIGTLEAQQRVEIRPEVDAVIEKVHFTDGQAVRKDDLLFTLDDSKLQRRLRERQQSLEAAGATLEVAKRDLDRYTKLLDQEAITKESWDEAWQGQKTAEEEVERLQARVALIEEQLEDTEIRSPVDAIASESRVDPGDFVSIADPLVTLYEPSPIEVAFWIPETYLGRIVEGQAAEVLVDAFPDRTFPAEVNFVGPQIEERTRKLPVKALVDDPDGVLKAGAFADVTLTVGVREDRAAVPEESLVATREGYTVFVVEEGTAERRSVRVGLRKVGMAEILEGVEVGETIVRVGHEQLSGGEDVEIVGGEKSDGAAGSQSKEGHRSACRGVRDFRSRVSFAQLFVEETLSEVEDSETRLLQRAESS